MYDPIMRVLTVLEILQAREHVSGAELAQRLEVNSAHCPALYRALTGSLHSGGIDARRGRGIPAEARFSPAAHDVHR